MLSHSSLSEENLKRFRTDSDNKPESTCSHIDLFVGASVPGTQVHAYFGPVEVEMFLRDRDVFDRDFQWGEAQLSLLERLSDLAREKEANAVIGLEVSLDPFACCRSTGERGLQLLARGTPAKLEFL
jgi:hypothetical protein